MQIEKYLAETAMLDYSHPDLMAVIKAQNWKALPEYERIGVVYAYVQNDILFGYNESDDIPASKVLDDGYGQCNTKGTLLMALFRGAGIPCRFHGFTIDKKLQKGSISGIAYGLAPRNIIHSWVEVFYKEKWINLEGFILDARYLGQLQKKFSEVTGPFCGYGVATPDFRNPPVNWQGSDTYIQKEGINNDYGIFDAPDGFFEKYGTNLSGIKKVFYKYIVRKGMNANVNRIRRGSGAP